MSAYRDFYRIQIVHPYSQVRLEDVLVFAEQGSGHCTVMIALRLAQKKMLFLDK